LQHQRILKNELSWLIFQIIEIMISRRDFFMNSAIAAAGITLSDKFGGLVPAAEKSSMSYNVVKEAAKYRKIDAHEHVGLTGTIEY
jgi:hypothetical protein